MECRERDVLYGRGRILDRRSCLRQCFDRCALAVRYLSDNVLKRLTIRFSLGDGHRDASADHHLRIALSSVSWRLVDYLLERNGCAGREQLYGHGARALAYD